MGKHLSELPFEFSTLVEFLRWRALRQPEQKAYTFLLDGEVEEQHLTYGELDCQARAIAALLQNCVASGERALLLYPPGLEFIAAFFGCLYAGVVAVPAYPPQFNRPMPRLQAIVADAQATVALTTTQILSNGSRRFAHAPDLQAMRWLATDSVTGGLEDSWQETAVTSDTLAFLQYTSGSAGTPKGVMVNHGNLLHNEQMIQQAMQHTEKTIFVGWLPLFHDMGLIGNMIQPLYLGIPCILMSPMAFLQRPLRWLQAISRYKATTSGGPNFAYELCVRKITNPERATLDLSSWEVAFNGAEPVRAETLERFATAFEPCGFRREAFYPCYGMAETTLIVSGGLKVAPPVLQTVQGAALEQNRVVPAGQEDVGAQKLVGCGQPLQDLQIVIAHPNTLTRCGSNEVGEIWVSGSSVAQGYWNRIEQTKHTFRAYLADTGEGPFLRTGDLGFLKSGELFITGRLKDLIVIRGRNHYPQDIEWTVEQSHPALQPTCGAAFSIDVAGVERLVVAQEVKRSYLRNLDVDEVIGAIRHAVAENHELQVYAVLLLKTGSILKTSSGKIQRHACRAGFLDGSLDVVVSSILEDSYSTGSFDSLKREALLAIKPKERQQRLESYLQEQVAQVLEVRLSRLDPQQPLSTLGLDSLMAVELKNSIETSLGVVLPMASFLQSPSIAQLATKVLNQLTELPSSSRITLLSAQEVGAEYLLSYGQQALYFLHQLAPESPAYNIVSALRIRAELDIPALQRAFQILMDRHPSLRTTFTANHGEPVQRVHEHIEAYFQKENISTWSEASLNDRLVKSAHRPFNLERGPLLRVSLFTRSAQEHILLLAVHHIVTDFWSLTVLVHELGMLYQAEKNGTQATLPPLALQYADYVRAWAEMLESSEGERLWAYWQKQLAGELPVLKLPTDRPRSPVQTYRGASQPFKLSAELTQELKALGRTYGTTLYMTLLAAFQVLLYRYTGQEDILVGSSTAGRNWADLAGLVGYFVNPVVLRADLSGNPTFSAFLSQVRSSVLDAFEHQNYPFALLVKRLQTVRDASRSPLFQVMFVLQKTHLREREGLASLALGETGTRIEIGGLELESFALEQRVAQFDLTLMMAEVDGALSASWQYNTDLFDAATIARMAGHFQTLLEGAIANPQQLISTLPLLADAEQHQLLVKWNDPQADYPKDSCLHQLFEAQVERTPDAIAVVFEKDQLTYQQLNRRANQLAHYLQALGVGPDVLVGICVERSLEMLVGILGILKAGGAYVPLDPAYPKEHLAFILEDTQAPVLLTQRRLVAELPEHRARIVCLDSEWNIVARESSENPISRTTSENLAYAIYTSGSTGRPKGVLVTHQNLVHSTSARIAYYREPVTSFLLVPSFAFDSSVAGIFWTLCQGGTLVLLRDGSQRDIWQLAKLIAQHQVSHWLSVPSLYGALLAHIESIGLISLRTVIVAGESCSRELVERHRQLLPHTSLFNEYGPTEGTVWSSVYDCQNHDLKTTVPIGRPIANTQIYLLDSHLQPVPIGVPGELHIGGLGLTRGYLNRPELTTEKFISNPFSDEPSARLYKTGDLARYLLDGNIEFLGRIDHQVKLRGYRIELTAIEAILQQHPIVREVVVSVRGDESDSQRLVAYVVPDRRFAPKTEELRSFLRQKLPEYMVPTAFVILDALPLTPNGKVDRRSLPAPEQVKSRDEKMAQILKRLEALSEDEVKAMLSKKKLSMQRQ